MNIGKRLRERRKELHFTQIVVADKLGMSLNFYGEIERGRKRLSLEKLALAIDQLGIDPVYILTGTKRLELNISDHLSDCPKEKQFDMEQLIKHASNLYK